MGLAIVFDFVLRTVRSRMIDVTGKNIDVVLAANIFEHVMAVKMAQRPTSVGIIANQLRDFNSVREFFTSGSVVSATDLIFAVLFIAVLFMIAGPLAWIPLADAAHHDRARVYDAAPARPCHEATAGRIRGSPRRAG